MVLVGLAGQRFNERVESEEQEGSSEVAKYVLSMDIGPLLFVLYTCSVLNHRPFTHLCLMFFRLLKQILDF